MSANSVHCHVLGGQVTVITDLAGNVTNVVCPEFSRLTHACRIKTSQQGLTGMFFAKLADRLAGTRANYCEFGNPDDSPTTHLVRDIRNR
jgi:hypothetical protein